CALRAKRRTQTPRESAAFARSSLELFIDDVQGATLDVALNAPEVLADQGQDEALDAEHEQNRDAAEQRPGKVRLADPEDEPVDAEAEGKQGRDRSEEDADPLDRLRPETREHVEREPRQTKRRIARRALTRGMRNVDLDDARSAGQDESLRELLLADRAEHRLHRVAAIRVERAAKVGDLDAGEAPEHAVDHLRRKGTADRVLSRSSTAARDVVARLDRLDEARDVLG